MNLKAAHMEQMTLLLASSPHWILQALGVLDDKPLEFPGRMDGKDPEGSSEPKSGGGRKSASRRAARRQVW